MSIIWKKTRTAEKEGAWIELNNILTAVTKTTTIPRYKTNGNSRNVFLYNYDYFNSFCRNNFEVEGWMRVFFDLSLIFDLHLFFNCPDWYDLSSWTGRINWDLRFVTDFWSLCSLNSLLRAVLPLVLPVRVDKGSRGGWSLIFSSDLWSQVFPGKGSPGRPPSSGQPRRCVDEFCEIRVGDR